MGKHSIVIASIPVTNADDSVNTVEISVRYEAGGMNYFNYQQSERGYYVSISTVKIERQNGYATRSFTLFSGYKAFMEGARRFSQQKLERLALQTNVNTPMVRRMLDKILAEGGLTIIESEAA